MKLTNLQLDTIINHLNRENEKVRNAEKEKRAKDKKIIGEAKKWSKYLSKLPSGLVQSLYIGDKISYSNIHMKLCEQQAIKTKPLDTKALREKIILASIDCKDFTELKKRLKINI